jgi:hypothetical protein
MFACAKRLFLSFIGSTQVIFADRHKSAPKKKRTTVGHPPTTTHRYAADFGSIVVHACMCKETIFVFHQIHPDDFCRPPPLHTTVGHPSTTTHRYAADSGSIVLHACMCKETIFVFHRIHPGDFADRHNSAPKKKRTTVGHPPTTTHRYAADSGSIVLHVCMCKETIFFVHQIHPDDGVGCACIKSALSQRSYLC